MTHTTSGDVTLRAGDAELILAPERGCQLVSLRRDGVDVLRSGERYGALVMAPWCGALDRGRFRDGGTPRQLPTGSTGHALHGTVRDARWRTVRADARSAAFSCALEPPWPYPGRVGHLVELAEDGSGLTLTLGVEATEDSFPAQAGWHPWFPRNLGRGGRDVELAWAVDEHDGGQLPHDRPSAPGPGLRDDCYELAQGVDVTLTWPDELELRILSRTTWVRVHDTHAAAVCVGPWSGPPNGLNTHPRLVTPIDPLEISTTWTWRGL